MREIEVLRVRNNFFLQDLSGLENLEKVGTLAVTGNNKITNLDEFSRLTEVTDLIITDNEVLSDLSGIQHYKYYKRFGDIKFRKTREFESLSKLETVGNDLKLNGQL